MNADAHYRCDDWPALAFFSSVSALARRLSWLQWPPAEAYYADLNALGSPCRFVSENADLSYELQVAQRGEVPTRYANWHDYFNALIWAAFPQSKLALNRWHNAHWSEGVRSAPRDAATILDEGGALVLSCDAQLFDDLRAHRWHKVFVQQREQWRQQTRVFLFGHGLLEKCLQPYIGMTAHAYFLPVTAQQLALTELELRALVDRLLAEQISADALHSTAVYSPLPVLGIPGWWPANEDFSFYDNVGYFRPARQRE